MRVAHVQIYRDRARGFRWRLRAANGRIVAQGEGHPRRADAIRAWLTVKALIRIEGIPPLVDLTRPRRRVR